MKAGLRHASHLFRMAGLFVAGIVLFLVVRALFVPANFGEYGFFRPGALADNRDKPLVYAGRGACAECHDEVVKLKGAGPHARIGCETCHGAPARTPTIRPQESPRCPIRASPASPAMSGTSASPPGSR